MKAERRASNRGRRHFNKIQQRTGGRGFFPDSETDWQRLIRRRGSTVKEFLSWAAQNEKDGASLRLENRSDLERVRQVLDLFQEPWWAVVVYSCFDSITGTRVAAESFGDPVDPQLAARRLRKVNFPRGSVQNHRTQPGVKGARIALMSACERASEFNHVLHGEGSFDQRYDAIRQLRAPQWGRTTSFDLILRTGILSVGGKSYRPEKAYLAGSTGPAKGFAHVWGITVTKENADECEELLHGWTERWDPIAKELGTPWKGAPYDSGDLENALCVFQESRTRAC